MPHATRRAVSQTTGARPQHWLTFNGTSDCVVLPNPTASDPVNALFIEAWVRNTALDGASRVIICRGNNSYTEGYAFSFIPNVDLSVTLRLTLKTPSYNTTHSIARAARDNTLPFHLAVGYDSATGMIHYFVNGMLVKVVTGLSGTLTYTGTNWFLGKMGANLWFMKGDLGAVRVSNICRYTASFDPTIPMMPDANTVALWRMDDRDSVTLRDSGPNRYNGTISGGTWGEQANYKAMSPWGDELWSRILATVPAVTDTNVYLKRVSADEYHVFRKIHATGPYWAKWKYARDSRALLEPITCWTGIPDPATDVPSDWTTDPATELMESTTENVFYGNIAGQAEVDWGSVHNDETLDTEAWYVDGALQSLSNGQWANGSEIKLVATSHHTDPSTSDRVCNYQKTHRINKTMMWMEREYKIDWFVDWVLKWEYLFPLMIEPKTSNLSTVTHRAGGTDVSLTAGFVYCERSNAAACWKADNGAILAGYIDFENGMRFGPDRAPYLYDITNKLYWTRAAEINGALAGTSWRYNTRLIALDNCGNHFLKTT